MGADEAEFGGAKEADGTKGHPNEVEPGLLQAPPRARSDESPIEDDEPYVHFAEDDAERAADPRDSDAGAQR